jgi:glycosyltransferase involved in cell wall biosynthesis
LGFLTPEEAEFVRRRFRSPRTSSVTGIGVDLDLAADGARFRERMGLDDRPYLVFVGRLDPHKGSVELFDYFRKYKERNPGPLALVAVGEPVVAPPEHPDVFLTGFVDDQTRRDAVEGALALVHPSYFESFSLVLVEAWAQRRPAIVQGRSDVLVGQSRRSGGGLPYTGYAEFEAAVDVLTQDGDLRVRMAEAGRGYVERSYQWANVLDRYESLLHRVGQAA